MRKPYNLRRQCKLPTLPPVLQNLQLQLIPPCQFLQIQRCSLFMNNHRLPQHLLNHGNYNWEINSYIKKGYYNLWKEVLFPQELFCEYFLGCFNFNYMADCLPFFVLPQLCLCYIVFMLIIANNFDWTVLACHVFAFLLKIPVLKMSKNMNFYCLNYRFDWYQTETHVVVTLMIKKSKKENVNVDYGEKTVRKLVSLSCMGKKLSIIALFFFF